MNKEKKVYTQTFPIFDLEAITSLKNYIDNAAFLPKYTMQIQALTATNCTYTFTAITEMVIARLEHQAIVTLEQDFLEGTTNASIEHDDSLLGEGVVFQVCDLLKHIDLYSQPLWFGLPPSTSFEDRWLNGATHEQLIIDVPPVQVNNSIRNLQLSDANIIVRAEKIGIYYVQSASKSVAKIFHASARLYLMPASYNKQTRIYLQTPCSDLYWLMMRCLLALIGVNILLAYDLFNTSRILRGGMILLLIVTMLYLLRLHQMKRVWHNWLKHELQAIPEKAKNDVLSDNAFISYDTDTKRN